MVTEGGFGGHVGGVYHGKVKFPPEYPYKPPGIRFAYLDCFLFKFMIQSAISCPAARGRSVDSH